MLLRTLLVAGALSLTTPAFAQVESQIAGERRDAALAAADAHLDAQGHAILRDLAGLVSIPNVASDAENIGRNAEAIGAMLERRGATVELIRTGDAPPIVYGRLDAPGAERTIALYVHYDGQPVDRRMWAYDPWEATLLTGSVASGARRIDFPEAGESIDPEWRLVGRSTSDDKAPIAAILHALDALDAAGVERTVNLVFFFEGEEEAGSMHLEQTLHAMEDRLSDIDLWLFCDGPSHQSGRPQLIFGVRGVIGLEITTFGALRPLHSGHYGNFSPNPAMRLANLLASMKDDEGRVLIDGFGDDTAALSPYEEAALDLVPPIDDTLLAELGLARQERPGEPYARSVLRPSLNIRGLASANVGEGSRNVVPTTATVSIDIRLAPGNDPARMIEIVEAHIAAQGFHIVRDAPDVDTRRAHERIAQVRWSDRYPAAQSSMTHEAVRPVVQAARRAARASGMGDLVLNPLLGGTLPIYLFTDILGKPAVITPLANHDNNQHAENEDLRVGNLWYGVRLFSAVMTME
ncbi:MAG: M20/M25/M40 family metallo-hydrolase [Phycisphaerales bacterium]